MNLKSLFRYSEYSKKNKIILFSCLGVIFLGLVGYGIFGYIKQTNKSDNCTGNNCNTSQDSSFNQSPTPTATSIPKVMANLDGSLVDPGNENLHPLAVMIENHPEARPQSGLSSAGLVYEAIAEGGITRFEAIFSVPTQSIKIGPIRSARSYFVSFAKEIDAFYAHVGGSDEALSLLQSKDLYNLDQFNIGEPVFKRDFTRNVALEHTMYSSTDKLWNYAINKKNWPPTGDFTKWSFQDKIPETKGLINTINVSVSEPEYATKWQYDPTSNSYLRFEGGKAHIDANNNQQIAPKNVVLQEVERTPNDLGHDKNGWTYTLTGSGSARIFQNGFEIKGKWVKQNDSRTKFYDQDGKEVSFVPGSIWIQITHNDTVVSTQ